MPRIRVGPADFDCGAELERLEPNAGAVASFLGIVRASSHGRRLTALTLEHYPAMTETALTAIAETAMRRWDLLDCLIIHRVGRLEPGARIVLTAAASPHRTAAIEATSFLIDWLKTDAPFWKREEFESGEAEWVAAHDTDRSARNRWITPRL